MRLFQQRIERKTKSSQAKDTEQVLVFRLQSNWFGILFDRLYRVLPLSKLMASTDHNDSLTFNELRVHLVDIGAVLHIHSHQSSTEHYVILIETSQALMGIVVDTPPTLKRFAQEMIKPLSSAGSLGNARFIRSMIEDTEASYFILDPTLLIESFADLTPLSIDQLQIMALETD